MAPKSYAPYPAALHVYVTMKGATREASYNIKKGMN